MLYRRGGSALPALGGWAALSAAIVALFLLLDFDFGLEPVETSSWGGLLVTLVVWRAEETAAATLSILVVLVLAVPSFHVALRYLGQVVPYGAILGATVVPLVVGLPERLTAERRLIQRQFGAYVSPEVLRELMSEPETLRRSQRQQVTLLFADVRGSTTLAEQTEIMRRMSARQWELAAEAVAAEAEHVA